AVARVGEGEGEGLRGGEGAAGRGHREDAGAGRGVIAPGVDLRAVLGEGGAGGHAGDARVRAGERRARGDGRMGVDVHAVVPRRGRQEEDTLVGEAVDRRVGGGRVAGGREGCEGAEGPQQDQRNQQGRKGKARHAAPTEVTPGQCFSGGNLWETTSIWSLFHALTSSPSASPWWTGAAGRASS